MASEAGSMYADGFSGFSMAWLWEECTRYGVEWRMRTLCVDARRGYPAWGDQDADRRCVPPGWRGG